MLYLNEEFSRKFEGTDPFRMLQTIEGNIYRQARGRKTFQFNLDGKSYFAKLHSGIGWGEILKNLLSLRLPVVGATNEWRAINRLQELGIATLHAVGYGSRGWNPASRESFIITEELANTISLEDFCKTWQSDPPDPRLRIRLVKAVARISRQLHENGICHRDLYLCHFHLHRDQLINPRLSLIDLHRALIKTRLGRRWIIKDIAGLYYSALGVGLTRLDLLRFIRSYSGRELRYSLQQDRAFWDMVSGRAQRMLDKLGPAF